jgi:integrase
MTALQRDMDRGVRVPEDHWTVAGYLAHWLESVVRPDKAPKTYQGYELVVRLHIVPVLGRKRLRTLGVPDIRDLLARLEEQGMSTRGIQQVHAVLRNALQSAMRDEIVLRNVAMLVQVKTPRYEVGRGLSVEQARTLLEATRGDRLHALYVLAVYLGLRRGELLGLRWRDVDLDQGTLQVRHTLQRVDGDLQFLPPKTRTSRRTVPLPRPCLDALRAHRVAQDKERLAAGFRWIDEDMVFASRVGTPIEPDNLSRSWYRVRKVLGDPPPRFHDLRHTCVSLLLAEGAPPHVVQQIVGHSAIDVTMTIYAHASLDEKRKALSRLGESLG